MQCHPCPHHPVRFQVRWKLGFHWPAKFAITYHGSSQQLIEMVASIVSKRDGARGICQSWLQSQYQQLIEMVASKGGDKSSQQTR